MIQKIINYIKRVRAEMEKVAWPTRKELANATGVVLVLVAIITVYLGIIDQIIYVIITRIIGL